MHRALDGVAAALILIFVLVEYVLRVETIPDVALSVGDAGLHVLIFGTLTWHLIWEKLNGRRASVRYSNDVRCRSCLPSSCENCDAP